MRHARAADQDGQKPHEHIAANYQHEESGPEAGKRAEEVVLRTRHGHAGLSDAGLQRFLGFASVARGIKRRADLLAPGRILFLFDGSGGLALRDGFQT